MNNPSRYLVKLGERIRTLRTKKGIDQKQFAFNCEIGRTTLHSIENGTANPSIRVLMRIAKELDVSLSDLVNL